MASGLIMAGMLGGAGQGLQQAGAQAQKAMDEKELQAARQSAEDKRQDRLLEAQQRMHTETITGEKERQKAGFEQEKGMEITREAFTGKMKSLEIWDKGLDRDLQAKRL